MKRFLPPADAEGATVGVGWLTVALAVVAPVGGAEVRMMAVTSPCGPGCEEAMAPIEEKRPEN